MKNLILGVALVACALGCKSEHKASVGDANNANMPKAECSAKGSCCSAAGAGACTDKKSECTSTTPKPQN